MVGLARRLARPTLQDSLDPPSHDRARWSGRVGRRELGDRRPTVFRNAVAAGFRSCRRATRQDRNPAATPIAVGLRSQARYGPPYSIAPDIARLAVSGFWHLPGAAARIES